MTDSIPRPRPPIPVGLSNQARQYLEIEDPFGDRKAPSSLDDVDGWLSYVEARNLTLEKNMARGCRRTYRSSPTTLRSMGFARSCFDDPTSRIRPTRRCISIYTEAGSSWGEVKRAGSWPAWVPSAAT